MSIPSTELQMKVARWRAEAAAGILSEDDCKEAIIFLRGERAAGVASAAAKPRSKSTTTTPTVDVGNLLSELGI